ncbi:MAG TPA: FtsX-like permease family protein [Candidatus Angelobacter sp.]
MKFRGLMYANLFRKKTRLILIVGCFASALFLFGVLAVVKKAFSGGVEIAGADRLLIINRTSIIQPLPLSYRERILKIPGVKQITYANWFGGVYQDERNFFPQIAVDVENERTVYPEIVVPDNQWQTFLKDRPGAIAGAATAKRFGWKVGDHIPIKGTFIPGVWDFNLDGIYHGSQKDFDETQFLFHWDYFEEKVPERFKGKVGWYVIRIANPEDAVRIIKAIDDEFSNSPYETRTDTEKSFAAGWVKQFGNIEFLVLTIGGVVFFTLLLVAGNTMAIAVRERTAEMAVLKAVGYSDRFVMLMVLLESLTIAAVGGIVGVALAKALTLLGNPLPNVLPMFYLPSMAVLSGLGIAVAIGAVSGIIPAVGAMRLRVVDALRRV